MVRLERLGIPTAAVATAPFTDEALEQARVLGMPDYRMVYVAHPVQLLSASALDELADGAFGEVLARLTASAPDGYAASESSRGRSSSA
ncbi:MAG TPA: hypothetical protein VKR21_05185 [Solirubrobacteraceae bacterium]|nr:hypothetical protein [Solirubrobacteraceae bacterium]